MCHGQRLALFRASRRLSSPCGKAWAELLDNVYMLQPPLLPQQRMKPFRANQALAECPHCWPTEHTAVQPEFGVGLLTWSKLIQAV